MAGQEYEYDNDDYEEADQDNPLIIAEKPTEILKLSVGEAVMKMEFTTITSFNV